MTVADEVRAAVDRDADVAVSRRGASPPARLRVLGRAIVLSAGARATLADATKEDTELRSSLEEGARFAGYPGWGDYRPDMRTARIALRCLETRAPRMLVAGLGDADEHAHRGDIAGYRRAIRHSDDFLAELDRTHGRCAAGDGSARHHRLRTLAFDARTWARLSRVAARVLCGVRCGDRTSRCHVRALAVPSRPPRWSGAGVVRARN
ncbi:MAG: hypothetical protein BGO98_22705 [Myxococcales bacterium 68-20]|nr:MAG: hypothetical protein BGO98_22705 [Myxococcales bacterium 68-20]